MYIYIYIYAVGILGRGISPPQNSTYTQENTNRINAQTDIHDSSWTRTHDPNVCASEARFHALNRSTTVICTKKIPKENKIKTNPDV
jgi:hypothetical protein